MAAATARRHETRALLRAHLAAASGYRHRTRHCPICHRLLRLAMEPTEREAPAPGPASGRPRTAAPVPAACEAAPETAADRGVPPRSGPSGTPAETIREDLGAAADSAAQSGSDDAPPGPGSGVPAAAGAHGGPPGADGGA